MEQFKNHSTFKSVCAFILAFMLMITNIIGLVEVKAAGIATPVKITSADAGSKEVKGTGLLGTNRRKLKNITTTIYVTVKNGIDVVEEASTIIGPTDKPKEWVVTLNSPLVAGYTVYAKQKCNDDMSEEVSVVAKESLASKYKKDLKMPTGKFWLEQFSSNIISDDEKAEALQMLKDVNPTFADKIASVDFKIVDKQGNKSAIYVVHYTDNSKTEEITATDLQIVKVTEHSMGYNLEPYNVVSTVIKGKLDGTGPFNDIKVQFSATLGEDSKNNFTVGGTCTIDKNSANFQTIDVNPQTGEFSIDVGEDILQLGKFLGIVVKEKHKFPTCNSSVAEIAQPEKVGVKDPKKITKEEKEKIAQAVREANKTPSGKSKLPDGTGFNVGGMPAIIEVSNDGKVKVISPNDVNGKWVDGEDGRKFVLETNEDGTVVVKSGSEGNVIPFDKPEKLVSNLAPDTPKMENKGGNIVVTPNVEVDTDAKKVVVEYEAKDGSKKTITATKTDTGWTVDDSNSTVDKNGVVSVPTKDMKVGTKVTASVEDEGGLIPEETALGSDKAELTIENKYKVTYKAGEGSGEMAEDEVEAGKEYTILKNAFIPPAEKEFDYWQVGLEKKKAGEKITVNSDVEITAIYKYVINPTIDKIVTKVDHPINYDMYKEAIKNFPSALKVEHIEVKTVPDISTIGTTEAEIEVRFSDGQFRTLKVTVGVEEDPKDVTIKKLNDKVTKLNTEIDGLNTKITEKDSKITELNGKITDLETKLQECKDKCAADKAQCEKDKQALRDNIAELEKAKSNLEIQVKENRELIEQLRKQIVSLEKQVEDWKKIAGEKDTKIKELENSIKDLNTKLETANNTITDLTKQLATATEKITGFENKVRDLESKIEELNNKVTELNKTIETKTNEVNTLTNKVSELENQITEEKAKSEADAKEIERLTKELEDLRKQLANKSTEVENLNGEISTLKETVKTLEGEKTELTNNVTRLETEVKELKDKLETNNNKIIELEKENSTLKETNKSLNEKVTELDEKVKKAEEENTTLKTKIDELNAKIAELSNSQCDIEEVNKLKQDKAALEAKLEAKDEIIQELRNQIAELKEKLKDLDALRDKIKELEIKISTLTNENANLKADLDKANEKITNLENQLAVEKTKNTELSEEVDKLKEAKDNLEGLLKKSEEDKNKLQDEKKELEKDLAKLKEDLSKCSTDEPNKIKELEEKITEKENLIKEKDKNILDKDAIIKELKEKLDYANNKIEELNKKLKESESESKPTRTEKEYVYIRDPYERDFRNRYERDCGDYYRLERDYMALKKENKELLDEIKKLKDRVYNLTE